MPIAVTSQTVAAHLTTGLTVVDLWAPWCGPCRALSPVLAELEAEMPLRILTLNIDDDKALAAEFGVQSIPTMLVYRAGKPVEKITGAYPKAQLASHFAQLMEADNGD